MFSYELFSHICGSHLVTLETVARVLRERVSYLRLLRMLFYNLPSQKGKFKPSIQAMGKILSSFCF